VIDKAPRTRCARCGPQCRGMTSPTPQRRHNDVTTHHTSAHSIGLRVRCHIPCAVLASFRVPFPGPISPCVPDTRLQKCRVKPAGGFDRRGESEDWELLGGSPLFGSHYFLGIYSRKSRIDPYYQSHSRLSGYYPTIERLDALFYHHLHYVPVILQRTS
jgi:hypothetical protein